MEYFFQFIIGAMATALGVFLGLFLQKQHEQSRKNKEAEEIKEKIKAELCDAIFVIKKMSKRHDSELFLSPVKTPVFKAYVDLTKITLLAKYPWYDKLLKLYKYIDDFNAWHNIKTNKSNIDDLGKIDESLKEVENWIMTRSDIIQQME